MTEEILNEIRKIESLNTAIISSVTLFKQKKEVEVKVITDKTFTEEDEGALKKIVRAYVPDYFSCSAVISKLSPDADMVKNKIFEIIGRNNRRLASLISLQDINVQKTDTGFYFEVTVLDDSTYDRDFIVAVCDKLKHFYCGDFFGKCVQSNKSIEDIKIEEQEENIDYEIPIRTFEICNFEYIESTEKQKTAVYLADLNFVSENVAVCGIIQDIYEKTIVTSTGKEKLMFNFVVNDGTASNRISYFARQKTLDKIRKLKVGDSAVFTCKTDLYRGVARITANNIDYGSAPKGFVPEKRTSKPVPKYYTTIKPQPFSDFTQDDMFTDRTLPKCLTENTFVVFDLETTGLNSSPSAGNMDRIIEIGAYKIINGEIKESFNTFLNPCRKLSEEIVALTGIDQSMVKDAPEYQKVMPDFFKFISGAYLVGHNAANFDYKFIDYYCSVCGYMPERKLFDTWPLAQQLLHLSNYKLNTVADYFGIKFNHHRASDDALVTAKIFIELLKLKKSLPTLC